MSQVITEVNEPIVENNNPIEGNENQPTGLEAGSTPTDGNNINVNVNIPWGNQPGTEVPKQDNSVTTPIATGGQTPPPTPVVESNPALMKAKIALFGTAAVNITDEEFYNAVADGATNANANAGQQVAQNNNQGNTPTDNDEVLAKLNAYEKQEADNQFYKAMKERYGFDDAHLNEFKSKTAALPREESLAATYDAIAIGVRQTVQVESSPTNRTGVVEGHAKPTDDKAVSYVDMVNNASYLKNRK